MRISKRSLLSVIALVLTMAVTAFGTVAYMTDRDQVINTFTVGNIDIIVDELDTDGSQTNMTPGSDPVRDQQNNYPLIPGLEQTKDPTITIMANSEECYVRFRVTLNSIDKLREIVKRHSTIPEDEYVDPSPVDLLEMLVDIDDKNWDYEGFDLENNVAVIEYRYEVENDDGTVTDRVAARETPTTLPALFNTFTVPIWMDGMDLAKLNELVLNAEGDAIQTDAFADVDAAWEAFDNQFGINSQELSIPEEIPTEDEGSEEEIIATEDQNPDTPVTDENVTE